MDLYFSPLACSMATRIALYEAGADADYLEVDPKTKRRAERRLGFSSQSIRSGWCRRCAPTTDCVLTENARSCNMSPTAFRGRYLAPTRHGASRLHQWLCFIGTELHKGLFVPVLDKKAPPEMKTYDLGKGLSRLDYLEELSQGPRIPARPFQRRRRLSGHRHQLDHGDAADRTREMADRESLLRAVARASRASPGRSAEEFKLYQAELARHKAAA